MWAAARVMKRLAHLLLMHQAHRPWQRPAIKEAGFWLAFGNVQVAAAHDAAKSEKQRVRVAGTKIKTRQTDGQYDQPGLFPKGGRYTLRRQPAGFQCPAGWGQRFTLRFFLQKHTVQIVAQNTVGGNDHF
jgi:hypothetical protein